MVAVFQNMLEVPTSPVIFIPHEEEFDCIVLIYSFEIILVSDLLLESGLCLNVSLLQSVIPGGYILKVCEILFFICFYKKGLIDSYYYDSIIISFLLYTYFIPCSNQS